MSNFIFHAEVVPVLKALAGFTARNDIRWYLNGIHCVQEGASVRLEASDSHSVARVTVAGVYIDMPAPELILSPAGMARLEEQNFYTDLELNPSCYQLIGESLPDVPVQCRAKYPDLAKAEKEVRDRFDPAAGYTHSFKLKLLQPILKAKKHISARKRADSTDADRLITLTMRGLRRDDVDRYGKQYGGALEFSFPVSIMPANAASDFSGLVLSVADEERR
ncbi:hypothetical protein MAF45_09635 [Mesosutterella sp. OilRF-GAM-744-9]|uniref:Uncharacterized protein n=1 Tax=Mesosutterella porci TaxID=2915351 RepID=A0ABS9MTQ1_9BURK|nr:hypothetical protein [Mesosutterella sp. oilRF-744-WT-GAM-9]MCG5031699.1 hypothetical protein [Mesosutterella sp. oilRF-744-WT-GAM-9]